MDYDALDHLLRTSNELEQRNKDIRHATADYSELRTRVLHGVSIPILSKQSLPEFSPESTFMIYRHPRFTDIPLHMHEWIEMTYVYSGSCTQQIDENLYNLTMGQLCLIDTGTPHAIKAGGEQDILINVLMNREYFSANFLSRFSSQSIISSFIINAISAKTSKDNYILFHSEHNRHLFVLMREIMCEYFSPSLHSSDVLDSYLVLIFLELIRTKEHEFSKNNALRKSISPLSVLQYMEEHYKNASLSAAAKHFSLNPSYLSTLLKEKLGFTYVELLHKTRVAQAKRLLQDTELSVTETAHFIGYENISFFYRIFKEETGLSPGAFRTTSAKTKMSDNFYKLPKDNPVNDKIMPGTHRVLG